MTTYLTPQSTVNSNDEIPPLENGDRLTRHEFERRYAADPTIRKAELIEGIVYVASPLRFTPHAEPHSRFSTWVGTYAAFTPGLLSGIEPTVRLDLDNEPQPDIVLLLPETVGGSARPTDDGYLDGVPELAIEIAASSASIDLGPKKQAYRRNGIAEYIVWQSFERKLDWFQLVDGTYVDLEPDQDGIIRSHVFPGLWLDVKAMLNHQMATVLEVLQKGLRSPEYKKFVSTLES